MARTLADGGRFEVLVCDRSEDALGFFEGRPRVAVSRLDLASGAAVAAAVASADVVVVAVPGFLGHAMLRTVIDAGKPVADISSLFVCRVLRGALGTEATVAAAGLAVCAATKAVGLPLLAIASGSRCNMFAR